MPLSEDKELQGFLPLADKIKSFDFKSHFDDVDEKEKYIRALRLINFGKWLTTYSVNNVNLIVR